MSDRRESSRGAAVAASDAFILRGATIQDLSRVAAIERECFGDPWSLESFRALLGDPRVLFLVGVESRTGLVSGYIVMWYVVDEAEIANLAVAGDARRSGLGARLLDAALAYADERGCRTMFLEVRDSNHAARALYRTRQFEEIGRRVRYYRHPVEDALVLRRLLTRR